MIIDPADLPKLNELLTMLNEMIEFGYQGADMCIHKFNTSKGAECKVIVRLDCTGRSDLELSKEYAFVNTLH